MLQATATPYIVGNLIDCSGIIFGQCVITHCKLGNPTLRTQDWGHFGPKSTRHLFNRCSFLNCVPSALCRPWCNRRTQHTLIAKESRQKREQYGIDQSKVSVSLYKTFTSVFQVINKRKQRKPW